LWDIYPYLKGGILCQRVKFKKQAKALILSNYGKALKLNILPVLGILLFGFILGIGLIYWVA
jgi:hypothetical protein